VARLVILTSALGPSVEILPALGLLSHHITVAPAEASALIETPASGPSRHDIVLVDARTELIAAKSLCRLIRATGISVPLLAILTEGGLAGLTAEWGVDDVLLTSAGPAEVEARLRLALGRTTGTEPEDPRITMGPLSIDEAAYSATLRGERLDLTYKEFELLKHLAQHPGRVFTRGQLLQEVWGYDYFGGTRTVDATKGSSGRSATSDTGSCRTRPVSAGSRTRLRARLGRRRSRRVSHPSAMTTRPAADPDPPPDDDDDLGPPPPRARHRRAGSRTRHRRCRRRRGRRPVRLAAPSQHR